jgi:hypothetical protein
MGRYKRPIFRKVTGIDFVLGLIRTQWRLTCRQCSGCHGCR